MHLAFEVYNKYIMDNYGVITRLGGVFSTFLKQPNISHMSLIEKTCISNVPARYLGFSSLNISSSLGRLLN